jgi:hypothetical protein
MDLLLKKLNEKLAEIAWSLWTELGVAGAFRRHKECLISLEELIILTAVMGEYDPRLREEALDWCLQYHHFVSVSRLKTLVKKMGDLVFKPVSIFAQTVNARVQANWPIFVEVSPLKFTPSGKSLLPSLRAPALLQLRLRSLFGVGARADLFTYFVTVVKGPFVAADLVDIGYGKRNLAEILDDLSLSCFLSSTYVRNQRKYELIKTFELQSLSGEVPAFSPPWQAILEILISLRSALYLSEKNSSATRFVVIRKELEQKKNLLQVAHLSPPALKIDFEQYFEIFAKWLLDYADVVSHGNFGRNFTVDSDCKRLIFPLIQHMYKIEDCLDGLALLASSAKEEVEKHAKIYRESYHLSVSFLQELKVNLQELQGFPFHQTIGNNIADSAYRYFKNYWKDFLLITDLSTQVNEPMQALRQYEAFQREVGNIQHFMSELRDALLENYSSKKEAPFVTPSSKLHKRCFVKKLYSL